MIPNSIELNIVWLIVTWVITTTITATATWYKLKGRIEKIDTCMKSLKRKQHDDWASVTNEFTKTNTDIKELKAEVKADKSEIIRSISEIKDDMHSNHINLIEAINAKR